MDVTNEDAMRHLCRSIHDRWGGLQLWVHTAIHVTALSPSDLAGHEGPRQVHRHQPARGGLPGDHGRPAAAGGRWHRDVPGRSGSGQPLFRAAYGITKTAQMQMARNWQAETAKTGPRVATLTPQPMPTATRARHYPGEDRSPLADPRTEALRLIDSFSDLAACGPGGYPAPRSAQETAMTDTDWTPPRVWTWEQPSGGTFASINRPIAGADA
jgi:NAD(P)-dependent dehydrogenase (short-subunit alcohol dehydrogenase family)